MDRLDRLVRAAVAGDGQRALIVGDPGIGKTALLDVTARRAARRRVRVLRIRGIEGSADQPFAVLDDLEAVCRQADEHPDDHSTRPAAFASAPGLAGRARAARDALAAVAGRTPVLLLVDDAHDADEESLSALDLAATMAAGLGVSCVVATRPHAPAERCLAAWPRLDLAPLDEEAATALLRSVVGLDTEPAVLRSLARTLQGVPLALYEAARLLTPQQLAGREPLPEPLPIAPTLMAAWDRVLSRLPERTRDALIDLAVTGPRPVLLSAMADPDRWGATDLDPAVAAGLITVAPAAPPAFVHPLVREVVLQSAPAAVLRHRHAVAAGQARALDLPPAAIVGHLTASIVLPDPAVSADICEQAERAERLGHIDAACRAWAAAARASVDPAARVSRALRGVHLVARYDLGVAEVARLLELLSGVRLDPDAAGWIAWLESVQHAEVDPQAALVAQWVAVERARRSAPDVLAVLLWEAAMSAWTLGEPAEGLRAAREMLALEESGRVGAGRRSPPWTGTALVAAGLIQEGSVEEGTRLRVQALAAADRADPHALDLGMLLDAVFLDDLLLDAGPGGAARLSLAVDRFRESGEPMACLMGIQAWRARATGSWDAARALLDQGRPAADLVGAAGATRGMAALAVELAAACSARSVLEDEADRLRVLVERWCDRRRRATLDHAVGQRALLDGRLDAAVAALAAAADVGFLGRGLRDGVLPARVDLVEALVRQGNHDEAARRRACVRDHLLAFADPLATALALRLDALVTRDEADADRSLEASLTAHAGSTESFEHARTLLLLGEHLRRTHRRRAARPGLAEAVARFERLGAVPWRDRAAEELRACGATVTASTRTPAQLTPQEQAVAEAVAAGRTNQEAADLLSLSPRTVEHHLSSCYRKLGVRGRTGLAEVVRSTRTGPTNGPDGAGTG